MLYRKDKKIIKIIRKQNPNLSNYFYDRDDIWEIARKGKRKKINEDEFISCLKTLSDNGYIYFGGNSHETAFRLCEPGRYYYEYRFKLFLNYIVEKWIDLLALIISIIALVVAIA